LTIGRWGQAAIPDEIVVGEGFTIQNNFSETDAKAKGKSVEDHITHWFRDDEHNPLDPRCFEVPLNDDVIQEPLDTSISPLKARSMSDAGSSISSGTSRRQDATADGSEEADSAASG